MSLARNLSKFKPSSSGLVETADIADDAVDQTKINADAVGTNELANDVAISTSGATALTNKLTVLAADGTVDNDYVMDVRNDEATDDRSFGLRVSAGSTSTDRPLDVLDHAQANTLLRSDGNGLIIKPQTPIVSATKSTTSSQTISGTNYYVIDGLDSGSGNSHSVNNKSYFDSSTSRYTNPSGNHQIYVHATLTALFGITKPGSGTNWGILSIRKNDSGGLSNNYPVYAYREINPNSGGAGTVAWETLNCTAILRLNAGQYIEPVFSGSAGVEMKVHPGVYTNFTVAQIA